jgi:hypothetical protein
MLWLQSPPWGRWLIAGLIAMGALWLELRPQTTVDHLFAASQISRGDAITTENTEPREVPASLLEPVPMGAMAIRDIAAGDPVLTADIGEENGSIPDDWWLVALEVPPSGRVGDRVRVVVVDAGLTVEGVIAAVASLDPLGGTPGAVALPAEGAAAVAAAALEGRVAILISTG